MKSVSTRKIETVLDELCAGTYDDSKIKKRMLFLEFDLVLEDLLDHCYLVK